jgi:hypothetical protein
MRKSSTLFRTRTCQPRDNYQRSLNSQLIPDGIDFYAPTEGARIYTGRTEAEAAVFRKDAPAPAPRAIKYRLAKAGWQKPPCKAQYNQAG